METTLPFYKRYYMQFKAQFKKDWKYNLTFTVATSIIFIIAIKLFSMSTTVPDFVNVNINDIYVYDAVVSVFLSNFMSSFVFVFMYIFIYNITQYKHYNSPICYINKKSKRLIKSCIYILTISIIEFLVVAILAIVCLNMGFFRI